MCLTNKSVYLKKPKVEELYLTEELLLCEKTMEFNKKWGGTISFSKDKWKEFSELYLYKNSKNIYFHIFNLDHVFVGEVSSRYIEDMDAYSLNIKILYRFRGNSHAFDTLELFFDYIFITRSGNRIVDKVAKDNLGAQKLLKSMGMTIIAETDEIIEFELLKKDWIY